MKKRIDFVNISVCISIISFGILEKLFFVKKFSQNYIYYIKPLIWTLIAVLCWVFFKKNKTILKKQDKLIYIVVFSILTITLYYLIGFLTGYMYSIYNHSFFGVIRNIFSFVIVLIPFEIIRYSLISHNNSRLSKFFILCAMIIIFLDIDPLLNIKQSGIGADYLFGTIIPVIISQVFLNYLADNCGLSSCILWQIIPNFVLYITPIFPNMNWFFKFTYGIIQPLITYVFLYYTFTNDQLSKEVIVGKKKKPTMGMATILIVFLILGFFTNMFNVSPIVIVSDSMNPIFYRGDMVVVDKKRQYDIGSIIVYNHDGKMVVHRIIDKTVDNNDIFCYITKGDNNSDIDSWYVYPEDIKAVYLFSLPKIGYLTIWLNDVRGKA